AARQRRQRAERQRLGGVQPGQAEPGSERFEPRDERRRVQPGHEARREEQRRGRERAAGLREHQHGERDLAEPVAELVEGVGEGEPAERRPSQRDAEGNRGDGHPRLLSEAVTGAQWAAPGGPPAAYAWMRFSIAISASKSASTPRR